MATGERLAKSDRGMTGDLHIDGVELGLINEPALLETAGFMTSHAGADSDRSYRDLSGPAIFMEGFFALTTKTCTKCGAEKDLSGFYADKRMKDGAKSACKSCEREYTAKYQKEHKEQQRAYRVQYYKTKGGEKIRARRIAYYYRNVERERAYCRAYRVLHREENKRHGREYYAANRERERQRILRWHAEHPENHRAADARRRARKLQAGGEHTAGDIRRQGNMQRWRCWWCGKKCKKQYHVDHLIPLAQGGHNGPGNIVIACPRCNLSKHDNLPSDWAGKLF